MSEPPASLRERIVGTIICLMIMAVALAGVGWMMFRVPIEH